MVSIHLKENLLPLGCDLTRIKETLLGGLKKEKDTTHDFWIRCCATATPGELNQFRCCYQNKMTLCLKPGAYMRGSLCIHSHKDWALSELWGTTLKKYSK